MQGSLWSTRLCDWPIRNQENQLPAPSPLGFQIQPCSLHAGTCCLTSDPRICSCGFPLPADGSSAVSFAFFPSSLQSWVFPHYPMENNHVAANSPFHYSYFLLFNASHFLSWNTHLYSVNTSYYCLCPLPDYHFCEVDRMWSAFDPQLVWAGFLLHHWFSKVLFQWINGLLRSWQTSQRVWGGDQMEPFLSQQRSWKFKSPPNQTQK